MDPFLGEIRLISFNFAPKGWALCNGQYLPINQNQALFALLGTTYGGDGRVNFQLPNLQGRIPMHAGNGHYQGSSFGSEIVTLVVSQLPAHRHGVQVSSLAATASDPTNAYPALADTALGKPYYLAPNANMASGALAQAGGSQPHPNVMPGLVLNYVIALQGIFPSQN